VSSQATVQEWFFFGKEESPVNHDFKVDEFEGFAQTVQHMLRIA
jgi:hypothetical protein